MHSTIPYHAIMGHFNDDMRATFPTCPSHEGLDNDEGLLEPMLATPQLDV